MNHLKRSLAWISVAAAPVSVVAFQQSVFRTATDVVTIEVSVQRRNSPVAGLVSTDFSIRDNGALQVIESVTTDQMPVDVSVVMEESSFSQSVIGSGFRTRMAALARLLRPADRIRLITFARDTRQVVPMQSPTELLDHGLGALAPLQVELVHDSKGRLDAATLDFWNDPRLRNPASFDAMVLALAKPPELGRRHLVMAFCSCIHPGGSLRDGMLFQAVAARADAVLHVAMWGARTRGSSGEWALNLWGRYVRQAVSDAAAATGGTVHDAGDGIDAFKRILDDFRHGYLLQYTLKGVSPEGWHDVIVTLPSLPQYSVRARKGYVGR